MSVPLPKATTHHEREIEEIFHYWDEKLALSSVSLAEHPNILTKVGQSILDDMDAILRMQPHQKIVEVKLRCVLAEMSQFILNNSAEN